MQEGLIGTVGAYYSHKGFGFLVQSSGETDIFMHRYEEDGGRPHAGRGNRNSIDKCCLNNSYDNADELRDAATAVDPSRDVMRGSELIYEFDLKSASRILALGGSCAVVLRTGSYRGGPDSNQPSEPLSWGGCPYKNPSRAWGGWDGDGVGAGS